MDYRSANYGYVVSNWVSLKIYRLSFLIDIKNILSRYLEYCKYLNTYFVGIKYTVSRH